MASAFDFRGFNFAPVACSYVLIACLIAVKFVGSVTKCDVIRVCYDRSFQMSTDLYAWECFLQGSQERV
jgi:hypothetical protein